MVQVPTPGTRMGLWEWIQLEWVGLDLGRLKVCRVGMGCVGLGRDGAVLWLDGVQICVVLIEL